MSSTFRLSAVMFSMALFMAASAYAQGNDPVKAPF